MLHVYIAVFMLRFNVAQ